MRDELFPKWCTAVFALIPLSEILFCEITAQSFYASILAALVTAMIAAVLSKIAPKVHGSRMSHWVLAAVALVPLAKGVTELVSFLWQTAFPSYPALVVVLFCLVMVFSIAQARFLRCAMWTFPIAVFGMGMVVLSLVLTVPQMVPSYLTLPQPALLEETGRFLLAMLPSAVVLALALPHGQPAAVTKGVTLGGCLLALCCLRSALVIGAHTAALLTYPNYSASGLASLGGIGHHGEVLFAAFLVLCAMGKCVMLTCVVLHPVWEVLERIKKGSAKAKA